MDPVTIKHISILGLGEPAKPAAAKSNGSTAKSKSKAAPSKAKAKPTPPSTTSK
jgi:hypothetical protein